MLSWKLDLALVVEGIGNATNALKNLRTTRMCLCIALNSRFIRRIVINIYPLNSQSLVNKCRIYDCRLLISTPLAVESSSFEMSPAMSQRTCSDPNLLKSTGVWKKETTTIKNTTGRCSEKKRCFVEVHSRLRTRVGIGALSLVDIVRYRRRCYPNNVCLDIHHLCYNSR